MKERGEAVHDGSVVDEDVDRSRSRGHVVEEGQRLGSLGRPGKAVDTRRKVKRKVEFVENAAGGTGQEDKGSVPALESVASRSHRPPASGSRSSR